MEHCGLVPTPAKMSDFSLIESTKRENQPLFGYFIWHPTLWKYFPLAPQTLTTTNSRLLHLPNVGNGNNILRFTFYVIRIVCVRGFIVFVREMQSKNHSLIVSPLNKRI